MGNGLSVGVNYFGLKVRYNFASIPTMPHTSFKSENFDCCLQEWHDVGHNMQKSPMFFFIYCGRRCFVYNISTFDIIQKQDYKMALRKYRKALRYLDVCWEKEEIDEGESLLGIVYFNDQLCMELIVF